MPLPTRRRSRCAKQTSSKRRPPERPPNYCPLENDRSNCRYAHPAAQCSPRTQDRIRGPLLQTEKRNCTHFEKEGYIAGFELETTPKGRPNLKIRNKFVNKASAIAGLKRVSKPGLRRYVKADEVPRVLGGGCSGAFHVARRAHRSGSAAAKRWRRIARLYLVTRHVSNWKKTPLKSLPR